MSLTVPFRSHRHRSADEELARTGPHTGEDLVAPGGSWSPPDPPADPRPATDRDLPPRDAPAAPVRVGSVQLGSALGYLLMWALVLFTVEVLVLWTGHTALERLGVLDAVSRATATVLGDPVPETGVLPALELDALLPWMLALAAAVAVLWVLLSLAVVLVHNCICAITGGPRVHLR